MTQIILNVSSRSRDLRFEHARVVVKNKILLLKNEDKIISSSEYFFCPALSIRITDGVQPTIITHSIPANSFASRKNTYFIYLNGKLIPIPDKDFTIRPLNQDDIIKIDYFSEENLFKILIAKVKHIDHSY